MRQEPGKRRRIRAYSPNRRPEMGDVFVDPHWNLTRRLEYDADNRGTTIGELIEYVAVRFPKHERFYNRNINRFSRAYKIPKNGTCPKCNYFVGQNRESWYLQGKVAICLVCHFGTGRNRKRSQAAALQRLLSLLGNPPRCWHCKEVKPTEKDKPGRAWIVREGYLPTCRACYSAGVKIISECVIPRLDDNRCNSLE